jgi:prepilin-type N-terminal cleavage/methylation domain-containing protein
MSSSERGFTLLEVLAAVVVLGLAYVALGSSGIQGLQHEGEARRRLGASLLADAALGDIEANVEAGGAPPLGQDETDQGDYRVTVEVAPYSVVIPDEAPADGKRLGRAKSRLGGDQPAPATRTAARTRRSDASP